VVRVQDEVRVKGSLKYEEFDFNPGLNYFDPGLNLQ
jgi:hypothetical protein